ncbi:MAG: RIP metalloprotease RseP [Deferribacteres bacterium]|nr:RIP metalloprotease RseP [Deferribacteres bacterium]
MVSLIFAIIALGVLIFVHELGHFLAAKWLGIFVEKFSIGFGPAIVSKKIGETEYALSLIPLGGYVKLLGEDEESAEDIPSHLRERAFSCRPVREKALVVLAGPLANIVFAFFLIYSASLVGFPSLLPEVGKVLPDTPAAQAGLKPGDLIVEINGKRIRTWDELVAIVHSNPDRDLEVKVKRNGKLLTFKIHTSSKVVKTIFGKTKKIGLIGIVASGATTVKRYNPVEAFVEAARRTYEMVYLTILGIVKIVERAVPLKSIGGPILIVQMAKQQAQTGLINFILFTALISINLGVINLLPIPVLDGGHLLFFMIEAILGRPISLRKKEIAQQIGLFIIIMIMVLAFYNDILRLAGR